MKNRYEVNGVVYLYRSQWPLMTGHDHAPYTATNQPEQSPKLETTTDDGGVFRMVNGRLRVVVDGKARKMTQRDREILHESCINAPMTRDRWCVMKKAWRARRKP